jgi:hypothetical protein
MSDTKIWDSKRGWVKPKKTTFILKRGLIIKRERPQLSVTDEDWDGYDSASINEEWYDNSSIYWKTGFTKKSNPIYRTSKHFESLIRFYKINKLLNKIPFVEVEVIE